jgi:hypothetical protein
MNDSAALVAKETFDELVFKRELNEVYLLLDFISGRQDRHVWDLDNKIPDPDDTSKLLSPFDAIERVCLLRYPPSGSIRADARNAAFLLFVRDLLNSIAYPARGLTIAYTYIFTEDEGTIGIGAAHKTPAQSRISIAREAYPGLITSAKRFRRIKTTMTWFAITVTAIAALLLSIVTYGVQITARFEEDHTNEMQVISKFYTALAQQAQPNGGVPKFGKPVNQYCTDTGIAELSNDVILVCNDYAYIQARYDKSIADVTTFGQSVPFYVLSWALPVKTGTGKQEDIQSITIVLSTFANYILPIIFGVVGTIASMVRSIQDKVSDSVLSPRDQTLAVMRLPLGLMAGVAVGLFFNPTTAVSQITAGAGVLTLSASGIAFLAGYGADGFFRMLDSMIGRLFTLDGDQRPAAK